MVQPMTAEQRKFAVRMRVGDGCWEWTGPRVPQGYGICQTRKAHTAHRAAWLLFRGPITDGACVLHSCDNPPCVRPDHLFLGTVQDNNRDRHAKGRTWMPSTRRITQEALDYIRTSTDTNEEIGAHLGFAAGSIPRFRRMIGTARPGGYHGQSRVMTGGRGGRRPGDNREEHRS